MMRLIDADAQYERACNLEAQALDYVGKLIERDGDKVSVEWKIWSAILTERTAFKHDVFDAPTIDAVSEWIPCSERLPEERQDVYVTVFWDGYGDTITAYGMRTQFGWLLWNTAEGELIKGYTVTAWMPLPKPYGERKESE